MTTAAALDWSHRKATPPKVGARGNFLTQTPGISAQSKFVRKTAEAILEGEYSDLLWRLSGGDYRKWLQENWDGEGAKPISLQTLINVRRFLSDARDYLAKIELAPEADGYIQLEWYESPNWVFSISFGSSNVLSYSGLFGEGCSVYGAEIIHGKVPDNVWALIKRFFQDRKAFDYSNCTG